MQMDDYKYISVLGRGHFGKVTAHWGSPRLVPASCGFPHSVGGRCFRSGIAGRIQEDWQTVRHQGLEEKRHCDP